jgi:hypothetical protein
MKRFLQATAGARLRRKLRPRKTFCGEAQVSSDFATGVRERFERRSRRAVQRQRRVVAVLLMGPMTMFAGLVWAIAQPYRIAFRYPEGKNAYDFLVQPPLLVGLVGLVFMLLIAPGLVEDLEREDDGPES